MTNWETYIAFGDSITIGARTYLGYPELVGDKLSNSLNKQWNVINHSVSGYKAIDLARHIDTHFPSLQAHKASISTILIGTNDLVEKTILTDFNIAVNQIIIKAKLLTAHNNIIIFTIPKFHKGVTYPFSIQMNDEIDKYNNVIVELAKKHSIRTVTLNHSQDDFIDGVHLNNIGIENFSTQISDAILKDKGIQ